MLHTLARVRMGVGDMREAKGVENDCSTTYCSADAWSTVRFFSISDLLPKSKRGQIMQQEKQTNKKKKNFTYVRWGEREGKEKEKRKSYGKWKIFLINIDEKEKFSSGKKCVCEGGGDRREQISTDHR